MKKLLSLLSVLTISGTAAPTTIAASPYEKEEKLNNNIDYLQIDNSENLIRNKRQNRSFKNYNNKLTIDRNDINKYKLSINELII